jgi:hypothetical protein
LALGYEDQNDHEHLREDPLLRCWRISRSRMDRWRVRAP